MPDITWADSFLPQLVHPSVIPLGAKSILDIGCGRGILGCMVRVYRDPDRVVALDVFRPYLDYVRGLRTYDDVIQIDVSRSSLPFRDKEFDVVTCLEVVEHLEKNQGLRILGEMERVGKRVVVSTPTNLFHQREFDGNENQRHMSQYSVRDFEKRGYTVRGVGSLSLFGHQFGHVSAALGPLTYFLPGVSSTVLAVKDSGV